jgi:hypothetical protein
MFAGGSTYGGSGGGATGTGGNSGSNSSAGGGTVSNSGYSNALAEANDLDALVFEYGTSKCKFGYAGEDFPRVYENFFENNDFASFSPEKAAEIESNPEELGQWMFDMASSRLQTKMNEHPLLFIERSFPLPTMEVNTNKEDENLDEGGEPQQKKSKVTSTSTASHHRKHDLKAREQLVEVLMEQLDVPALFCAKSAVLTCYANARTSGLVVEMGASYTSVTSVHEGYALPHPKTQYRKYGGFDLEKFLALKLEKQLTNKEITVIPPSQKQPWNFYNEAKESGLLRVADNSFDENLNAQVPLIPYELPDKTIISLGTERFSVPERYFMITHPDGSTTANHADPVTSTTGTTVALDDPVVKGFNLPEWICEVGSNTIEADLRKDFFQNIVLTGGSSMFENMPNRLEKEILSTLSTPGGSGGSILGGGGGGIGVGGGGFGANVRVKVIAAHPQERKVGSFLGGSILGSLGSFHEMWMSKREYVEHGAALIHKKCP